MKILLVDDHLLFLEGLRLVLSKLNLSTPVQILEAHSPAAAREFLAREGPEVELALVDLNFPDDDGLVLLDTLIGGNLLIPVIVLSAEEDISRIKQAMDKGASGFIPKSLGSEEMVKAISQVLEGPIYVPENIGAKLAEAPEFPPYSDEAITAIRKNLGVSKRQYDTLVLLARGLSNKAIAEELHLSENTVKSHISMLFQLLEASNRTDCLLKAREKQLISDN